MSIGALILVVIGILTYQRCRSAGRSPFAWIPVSLLVTIATLLVTAIGVTMVGVTLNPELTQQELNDYLFVPLTLAAVFGGGIGVWLAGRPLHSNRAPGTESRPR